MLGLAKEYHQEKKTENPSVDRRNVNADLLRVLACLFVIGVHSTKLPKAGAGSVFFATLFADGVPVFFILSGFFMFRKTFRATLKRTILHVLIPGLITLFAIELFYPLYQGLSFGECLQGFPSAVMTTIRSLWTMTPPDASTGYLWYVLTYFMIVLAYPLLKAVCRPETPTKHRCYIIAFCLFIWLFTDLHTLNEAVSVPGLAVILSRSFVYVVAGYEIWQHKDRIRGDRRILWGSLALYAITQLMRLFLQLRLFDKAAENGYFIETSSTLPTFITAAALVLFFMSLDLNGKWGRAAGFIAKAGPYTFFVYLVHGPVIKQLTHMGFCDWAARLAGTDISLSFGHCLIYFLLRISIVFAISLAIAWLLKKLTKALGRGVSLLFYK